jgi:hypothetical protein
MKNKANTMRNKFSYLSPIIAILLVIIFFFSCLGFTEIDSSKSWCKEKLGRSEGSEGYWPFIYLMCRTRSKRDDESQESYDVYLKSQSEGWCKDKITYLVLDLYLVKKKNDKCKKINSFEPTLHEPTAIIEPGESLNSN